MRQRSPTFALFVLLSSCVASDDNRASAPVPPIGEPPTGAETAATATTPPEVEAAASYGRMYILEVDVEISTTPASPQFEWGRPQIIGT